MNKQYGRPFWLPGLDRQSDGRALEPIPYGSRKNQGGYDEDWLENLIAAHPEILPFDEIDPAFREAVSICTQLPIGGNFLDNFLATDRGELVLVECKLWRNPEARRQVVGQILEYASEVATWKYEHLDEAVRRAKAGPGFSKDASLFQRVSTPHGIEEERFVDAVSRNLARGRFLLLVVGDGIREGVTSITGFLQQHAGLHFDLGLAELAVFPIPSGGYLVQPRVLAVTERVLRGIVLLKDDRIQMQPPPVEGAGQRSTRVAATITEELLYDELDAKKAGLGAQIRKFLDKVVEIGITKRLTSQAFHLEGEAGGQLWPLCSIDCINAHAYFESVAKSAKASGRGGDAAKYYEDLVGLLDDPVMRAEKLKPGTTTGMRTLPVPQLLAKQDAWINAMQEYLRALGHDSQ